jgi:hypothetical protein
MKKSLSHEIQEQHVTQIWFGAFTEYILEAKNLNGTTTYGGNFNEGV